MVISEPPLSTYSKQSWEKEPSHPCWSMGVFRAFPEPCPYRRLSNTSFSLYKPTTREKGGYFHYSPLSGDLANKLIYLPLSARQLCWPTASSRHPFPLPRP